MPFGFFKRQDDKQKVEHGLKRSKDSWIARLSNAFDVPAITDDLWDELEEILISADVGIDTTGTLIKRVKERIRKDNLQNADHAEDALMEEMIVILNAPLKNESQPSNNEPWVILVVGVNGTGKTTTIAKLARYFQQQGKSVVLAAADTFRAAAVEQLDIWGKRVGATVISHQQGADPGAVTFDAIQAARSRSADVVIVDTAGRLHTKSNLMEELKKVNRVIQRLDPTAPHEVLLVLDATTGQNGLTQARAFTEAVGVTGVAIAKFDGTAKGGIVLSITDQLKLPVLYLGTGEGMDDLVAFDPRDFVEAVFD
ncbi:MAG: signal recognition particle-docking protein FtsY [Dehalococcoidia bacterium]|nr:signal recognition particle-docking protein FtsY [Dehalococcoidia bacterium]